MALPSLTTILNNAPLIIQGANKLLDMMREKNQEEDNTIDDIPSNIEDLKNELKKINTRLDSTDNSNIQQIQLIEALAKQNESLANSLQSSIKRLNIISVIAILALVVAVICLVWFLKP